MLKPAVGVGIAASVFLCVFVYGYLAWGTDALEKAQVVTRAAELLARPDLCLEISEGMGFFDSTLTRERCRAKTQRSGDIPEDLFREFIKNYGLEARFAHFRSLVEVRERKSDWDPPGADPSPSTTPVPEKSDVPATPTRDPSSDPTPGPSSDPTPGPSSDPTPGPSSDPTPGTSSDPTPGTSSDPTPGTSSDPTPGPSSDPTPGPSFAPAATPSPVAAAPVPPDPDGERAYANWQRLEFIHCEVDSGSLARHLGEIFDLVISVYWGKPSPRPCAIGGFIGLPRADSPLALHSRSAALRMFYPKVDFLLDCPQLRFGFRKDFCHLRAAAFRRGTLPERKAHCLAIGADNLRLFCQNLAAEAGDQPHPTF